jgi:hypothetical protein
MPERILMSASLLLEDSTKANIEKIKQNLGKKINLKFLQIPIPNRKSKIYNRFIFSNSLIISSIGSVPTEILIILASNPASSKNFLPSSVCNKS